MLSRSSNSRGGNYMAEGIKKTQALPAQADDAKEIMELLQQLDTSQKQQVKGIMIGMQMMKQQEVALPA